MNRFFLFIAVISFTALAIAFASEAFFGLEPCRLCIYQRWPFAVGIVLGVMGVFAPLKRVIAGILALNFLTNSGVAFYHTGVEQRWWQSAVDGCSITFFDPTQGQSILENIMSTPMASCEDIPWQDPVIGLSMANYNVAFCLGLAGLCLLASVRKP